MSKIRANTQIQAGTISAALLEAAFSLPLSQLAGSASLLKNDGTIALAANLNLNGFKAIGSATPTAGTDLANKSYVDAVASGLGAKHYCKVMSITNVPLTGLLVLDTITTLANDVVFLAGQTNAVQNGLWVVSAAAWTRPAFYPAAGVADPAMYIFVQSGGVYGDTGWVLTNDNAVTIDTTATTWVQFSGAGQIDAGVGLTKSGNQLNVGAAAAGGITVNPDSIEIKLDGISLVLSNAGIKVNDSLYILASKVTTLSPQTLTGTVDGTNLVFVLPSTPVAGTVSVLLNGQVQRPTTDYAIAGSNVTFVTAPSATGTTDWVAATYIAV
jgi:hypothetical protein